MARKLIEVARHRNGICGEPFYVVLFDESKRRMAAFVFEGECRTAITDVAELAKGNIAMAEGNSWRGDHYDDWLREQIAQYEAARAA